MTFSLYVTQIDNVERFTLKWYVILDISIQNLETLRKFILVFYDIFPPNFYSNTDFIGYSLPIASWDHLITNIVRRRYSIHCNLFISPKNTIHTLKPSTKRVIGPITHQNEISPTNFTRSRTVHGFSTLLDISVKGKSWTTTFWTPKIPLLWNTGFHNWCLKPLRGWKKHEMIRYSYQ